MATRETGYTDEGRWHFWTWVKDIAAEFQQQCPYFMGFAVGIKRGYPGFMVTLVGEGHSVLPTRYVDALEIKLKEFARKEAGKVAPNLVFEVKIINDRQVICDFDVAGF